MENINNIDLYTEQEAREKGFDWLYDRQKQNG